MTSAIVATADGTHKALDATRIAAILAHKR